MAIECYEDTCPYHCINNGGDEGPFCFEEECCNPKYKGVEEGVYPNYRISKY